MPYEPINNGVYLGGLANTFAQQTSPDDLQAGPLSAALNRRRQGSMSSSLSLNGSAPQSPLSVSLNAARSTWDDRFAAMAQNATVSPPQLQTPDLQAASQVQNATGAGGNPGKVQVIRGGVESSFDWGGAGPAGETMADGTPVPADYAARGALYGYDPHAGGAGDIAGQLAQQRGNLQQKDSVWRSGANTVPQQHQQQAHQPRPAPRKLPQATLDNVLSQLTPEQAAAATAYRQSGATDEEVMSRVMSMTPKPQQERPVKEPGFGTSTQQDRYLITQAQHRIHELDAKVKKKNEWEDDKTLSPAEQAEYNELKSQVAGANQRVAGFGSEQRAGQVPRAPVPGTPITPEATAAIRAIAKTKQEAIRLAQQNGWAH